jgi:hypothetical protein
MAGNRAKGVFPGLPLLPGSCARARSEIPGNGKGSLSGALFA